MKLFKIGVYIPLEHKEKVKDAMFGAGAGKIGNYDSCSFEILGTGQFRPLSGSRPFIGIQDAVERVSEVRVEMICPQEKVKAVVVAMKKSHPYEEVAFDIVAMENPEEF
jgi:hypothetical protein